MPDTDVTKETGMYVCQQCGYIYDPSRGDRKGKYHRVPPLRICQRIGSARSAVQENRVFRQCYEKGGTVMCMAHETSCSCGSAFAGFNFKNEIMSGDVIRGVYCPSCARDITFDPETMVVDNRWIIKYDMEIARFQARILNVKPENVTPDFIFDEGYCTWRGIYPSDHLDSVAERCELVKLAKINPRKYLEEIREWANARMERLSKEGWRKAREIKVLA